MAEKRSVAYRNAILAAIKTAFTDGVIYLYTGGQPASADAAETGTLLAIITNAGGAFTSGVATNGLEFDTPANGSMGIKAGETWKTNACLAQGNIGWGRFYANTVVQGVNAAAVRFDFSVGTSGADLNVFTTLVAVGSPFTINTFTVTI